MDSFVEGGDGGGSRRETIYKGSELRSRSTKYGPLGARVYWDRNGEAKGPEPQKSIQLQRVETLGQTFSALLILTFFTTALVFWKRQLQNIPELSPTSQLTTRTSTSPGSC
jgi:hypothetical protein